jgi:hypothetical protein
LKEKGIDVSKLSTDEDFGLLGIVAIATPTDSASFSARSWRDNGAKFLPCNRYDFVTYPVPSDTEESDPAIRDQIASGLQTVLLFVKKNPAQLSDSQPLSRQHHAVPDTFWKGPRSIESTHATPLAPGAVPSKVGNGDELGKKGKKRHSQGAQQLPPTAFTRLAGGSGVHLNRLVPEKSLTNSKQSMKGDYRHQVLASFASRMRTTGMTMFDSYGYKVAAIRVARRASERLERLMWKSTLTSQLGPGLPLQLAEDSAIDFSGQRATSPGWTSIARELGPGAATGDAAMSLSNSQRAAFTISLVSPCRADFGPFESGFLSSPSGMNSVSSPRSRLGVSLPMGVKMIKHVREHNQARWSSSDEKMLQIAAKKFDRNWLLVASKLSGLEGVIVNEAFSDVDIVLPATPRSARQCRDHWHALPRIEPLIPEEARKSEILFHENASGRGLGDKRVMNGDECEIRTQHSVSFLLRSSLFLEPNLTDKVRRGVQTTPDSVDDSTSSGQVNENTESPKHGTSLKVESHDDKVGVKAEDLEMSGAILPREMPKKIHSFSAIFLAKSKRQIAPVAIPGLVCGSPPNHPVPPHLSHIKSVQASVTAQWASGRTEMWPLQILDLTDKQKNVARPVTVQRPEKSVTTSSSRQPVQNGAAPRPTQVTHPSASSGRPLATFPPIPTTANRSVPVHHRPPQPPQPHVHTHVASTTAEAYLPPPGAPAKSKNAE